MSLLIWFFIIQMGLNPVIGTLVSMRGGEYISKNIRREEIHSQKLHVVFQFKTIDPSSLLLFSANHEYGDYISLELIGGKLR
jgi:hypothetical protein